MFAYCSALGLLLAAALAPARDKLRDALEAGRLNDAAKLLARAEQAERLVLSEPAIRALLTIDAAQLGRLQRALREVHPAHRRVLHLLNGLDAHRHKDARRAVEQFGVLVKDPALGRFVLGMFGRDAMQLCRAGDPLGVTALDRLRAIYPRAAWAVANLALGLRLVGRYADAHAAYTKVLGFAGRKAWVLNDLGLLHQAEGHYARALALFQEGADLPGDVGAADTCRGNAAMLFLRRDDPGDVARARTLLAQVVARDPTRVRSAYWLAQLRRPGGLLPNGRRQR